MKNSKQHLTDAFAQLQEAQINLKHALDSAEKLNNKQNIGNTLSLVEEAVSAAASSVAYYQDTNE
ncbi:hypothetical protein [Romboutsia sp. 13368]|uniref:hypothetical protein n=1 Tax=Romboutsia sp. 13368 TaxID=2708053 RepID=UPI0025E7F31D|nr:hypothetical protein [Romboutsia sp. 13368]